MKRTAFAALALACASLSVASAAISTFDDPVLAPGSYWNGSGGEGSFTSGDATFKNSYSYSTLYGVYWDGFSYSNTSDTGTAGSGNQYSANTGAGVGGTGNYAVFNQPFGGGPSVTFSGLSLVESMMVTNTTYATQSMLHGDGFAKAFGGDLGDDADWFKLTITGYVGDTAGLSIDFYLADYRGDNGSDYIIDDWTAVNLSALGEVTGLGFTLSSSDNSGGYMNTPAYFAMDNLHVVPEPSTAILALIGLAPLLRRRRAA